MSFRISHEIWEKMYTFQCKITVEQSGGSNNLYCVKTFGLDNDVKSIFTIFGKSLIRQY